MACEPKPGDLLQCYNPSLLRDAIVAAERIGMLRSGIRPPRGRPVYSHTAVYVGNDHIIEALGAGLVRSPASKHLGHADVWTREIDASGRENIVRRAEAMYSTGYRYAWMDLGVQLVHLTLGLRISYHFDHSIICSVFGYDCWAADGWKVAKRRNCDPEDIALGGVLHFAGDF
ncbi:MAG: hypothetical protein ACYCVB_00065 [Bacilli bacterium]